MLLLWTILLPQITTALYTDFPSIVQVDRTNYDTITNNTSGILAIQFYAKKDDKCVRFASTFRQYAYAVRGVIKLGALNIDECKFLHQYFDVEAPSVVFYYKNTRHVVKITNHGTKKLLVETLRLIKSYTHQKYENQMKSYVLWDFKAFDSPNFKRVIRKSETPWIIFIYGKFCIICLPYMIEWRKAFENYSNDLNYGAIDASVQTDVYMELNLYAFPAVIYSYNSISYYNQNITVDGLRNWTQTLETEMVIDDQSVGQACQLTKYCVVAVLPPIEYCTYFKKVGYHKMINGMMRKYYRTDWNWVWFHDNDTQVDLEYKKYNLSELPTMLMIDSTRDKMVGKLEYDFDERGLYDFLAQMDEKLRNVDERNYNFQEVIDFIDVSHFPKIF